MCYNVAYIEDKCKKVRNRFFPNHKVDMPLQGQLPYGFFISGFSHPKLLVLKNEGWAQYQWGLIPPWVRHLTQTKEIQKRTLNAIGETIWDKPSFKLCIAKQRCLLPVSGFYEWRSYKGKKYPYFITPLHEDFFVLGCVYNDWCDVQTGEVYSTFSILTTEANSLMVQVHNEKRRMPLILPVEDAEHWLEPNLTKAEIDALITPFNSLQMKAHTVAPWVSNTRNERDVPEAIIPYSYDALPPLEGI